MPPTLRKLTPSWFCWLSSSPCSNPTDRLISAACHTSLGLLQKAITWNKWAHFNKETSVAGTYCASEHLVTAAAADSRQGCFLAFIVSRLFAELEAASHSEAEDRFLSWQISWEQPPSQVQPNNIAPGQFLRCSCPCDKRALCTRCLSGCTMAQFLGVGAWRNRLEEG